MTAIQEKGAGNQSPLCVGRHLPCRGLGLAGPAAEMSRLWMQYKLLLRRREISPKNQLSC